MFIALSISLAVKLAPGQAQLHRLFPTSMLNTVANPSDDARGGALVATPIPGHIVATHSLSESEMGKEMNVLLSGLVEFKSELLKLHSLV